MAVLQAKRGSLEEAPNIPRVFGNDTSFANVHFTTFLLFKSCTYALHIVSKSNADLPKTLR